MVAVENAEATLHYAEKKRLTDYPLGLFIWCDVAWELGSMQEAISILWPVDSMVGCKHQHCCRTASSPYITLSVKILNSCQPFTLFPCK